MFVKVVRNSGGEWTKEEIPPCSKFTVTRLLDDEGADIGRQVELHYDSPLQSVIIKLLQAGDVLYLEDALGNTTDSIKWWPPRESERVIRVTKEATR